MRLARSTYYTDALDCPAFRDLSGMEKVDRFTSPYGDCIHLSLRRLDLERRSDAVRFVMRGEYEPCVRVAWHEVEAAVRR